MTLAKLKGLFELDLQHTWCDPVQCGGSRRLDRDQFAIDVSHHLLIKSDTNFGVPAIQISCRGEDTNDFRAATSKNLPFRRIVESFTACGTQSRIQEKCINCVVI